MLQHSNISYVGDLSKSLVIMVMMRSLDLFRESLLPVMVYRLSNVPNRPVPHITILNDDVAVFIIYSIPFD